MKFILKTLCCIMAIIVFSYLIFWDYPVFKESLSPVNQKQLSAGMDEDKEVTLDSLDEQIKELKNQRITSGRITLVFDQINHTSYEELYPLMEEKGYSGVLVMREKRLPGDYLQITKEECEEMLDEGWTLAVGGSNDIDMTGDLETVMSEWTDYLTEYVLDIKEMLGTAPTMYCFDEGEYKEEFDTVLKELGFTTIRYFGKEDLEGKHNGITRIQGYRISEDMDVSDMVKALKEYTEVDLSTRLVTKDIDDSGQDMDINTYEQILDAIEEEEKLYIAGSDKEAEIEEGNKELNKQIKKLQAQKKKLEAE